VASCMSVVLLVIVDTAIWPMDMGTAARDQKRGQSFGKSKCFLITRQWPRLMIR